MIYYKLIFSIFLFSIFGSIIFFNLVKKLLLLGIAQTCVILIYTISGYYNFSNINDNFYINDKVNYVDPVPQALMLTAIVVGLITTSIGFSLILKIKKSFLTIEDNLIQNK